MPWHRVKQGECLSSLAVQYGLSGWRAIYHHPENERFRQLRDNPNLLYPGDRVFIPAAEQKVREGPSNTRHRFRLKSEYVELRIVFEDERFKPLAGLRYELDVEGDRHSGTTTSEGAIECTIEASRETGTVTLWESDDSVLSWTLSIGHLDPIDRVEGVQSRLNNLGYQSGAVDGVLGPRTKLALSAFQRDFGLDVSAGPNDETERTLVESHDHKTSSPGSTE